MARVFGKTGGFVPKTLVFLGDVERVTRPGNPEPIAHTPARTPSRLAQIHTRALSLFELTFDPSATSAFSHSEKHPSIFPSTPQSLLTRHDGVQGRTRGGFGRWHPSLLFGKALKAKHPTNCQRTRDMHDYHPRHTSPRVPPLPHLSPPRDASIARKRASLTFRLPFFFRLSSARRRHFEAL